MLGAEGVIGGGVGEAELIGCGLEDAEALGDDFFADAVAGHDCDVHGISWNSKRNNSGSGREIKGKRAENAAGRYNRGCAGKRFLSRHRETVPRQRWVDDHARSVGAEMGSEGS